MANDDVEVEIKVPLDGKKFSDAKEKLKGIAKYAGSSSQADTYFSPIHRNFVEPEFPFEWLSIRKR